MMAKRLFRLMRERRFCVGRSTRRGLFVIPLVHMFARHPHGSGEYFLRRQVHRRVLGSSPRMRGILFDEMQKITSCQRDGCILPNQAKLAAIPLHEHQKREGACAQGGSFPSNDTARQGS